MATRPADSTITREHSFSTMSNRCVLKKTIRPSRASRRTRVRSSNPAFTSRPENQAVRYLGVRLKFKMVSPARITFDDFDSYPSFDATIETWPDWTEMM
jgi:hypothetical protein